MGLSLIQMYVNISSFKISYYVESSEVEYEIDFQVQYQHSNLETKSIDLEILRIISWLNKTIKIENAAGLFFIFIFLFILYSLFHVHMYSTQWKKTIKNNTKQYNTVHWGQKKKEKPDPKIPLSGHPLYSYIWQTLLLGTIMLKNTEMWGVGKIPAAPTRISAIHCIYTY